LPPLADPYAPEKQSDGKDAAHRHHAGVCSHGLAGDWMYVMTEMSKRLANHRFLHSRAPDHVLRDWSSKARRHGLEYDIDPAHYSRLGLFLLPAKLVRQSLTGKD
jgi:hypothetical protein